MIVCRLSKKSPHLATDELLQQYMNEPLYCDYYVNLSPYTNDSGYIIFTLSLFNPISLGLIFDYFLRESCFLKIVEVTAFFCPWGLNLTLEVKFEQS